METAVESDSMVLCTFKGCKQLGKVQSTTKQGVNALSNLTSYVTVSKQDLQCHTDQHLAEQIQQEELLLQHSEANSHKVGCCVLLVK